MSALTTGRSTPSVAGSAFMSSCSVCEPPQKPVYLVQGSHGPRNFSGALASHMEALQSLVIMEHEGSVKALQIENRQLRDRLQAVDSAVHGSESAVASLGGGAQPKEAGRKAHAADDAGGVLSRLTPVPSGFEARSGRLATNEAKDDSEEGLSRGLRKALEELRSDAGGIKRQLQDVSTLCAEVTTAVRELPNALLNNQGPMPGASVAVADDREREALIGGEEAGANLFNTGASESSSPERSRDGRSSSGKSMAAPKNSRATVGHKLAPEEMTRIHKLVFSNSFELGSGLVILLNTFFMALQLQYDGFSAGFGLRVGNYRRSEDTWPGGDQMFYIANMIFNSVFTIELLLRYVAMGKTALYSLWIWFDTVIVALGLADLVANEIAEGGLGMDPTMIRVARLVRLVRMLKVFKTMTAFDSLFLLIKSIHASFHALVWSFLLLLSVQITAGMFLCQMLNGYIVDLDEDTDKRKAVFLYFGTFTRTMLTMFEITLANWVPSCRTLVEGVGEYYMIFYIVYRCMFCFAVLKVIAAVFITETNRVLASDDELTVLKTRREKAQYTRKLRNVFVEMDLDNDGLLDSSELLEILSDDHMVSWLATLGFEGHDFEKVFYHDCEKDEKIDLSSFLTKVGKAKGQAKTIDIFLVLQQLTQLQATQKSLIEKLSALKAPNS